MKLKLIKGMVLILDCELVPTEALNVPIEGYDNNAVGYVKINNIPKTRIRNGMVRIPKPVLESDSLYIEITVDGVLYKSDKVAIKKMVLLNEEYSKTYPGSFHSIRLELGEISKTLLRITNKQEDLDNRLNNIETEGDLI